ncbi:hypothetical protein SDC9_55384 [bioreactor metagenome]|uniref:Uncharacterized protein n=1 Tax=bioreactor metagenome TaxID=1076179 RepID=A0A644WZW0_9ZZZZ
MQLHFFGCVHCVAELASKDFKDFRHTEELIVRVRECEPQRLAALDGGAEERLVLGARLRAAHRRLQHTEDGELLFEWDVGGCCRRSEGLDALGHAGAGSLKRPDTLGYSRREHGTELHVGEVVVVVLVNTVARRKERGHFRGRGLRCLCGQRRKACKLCDALI